MTKKFEEDMANNDIRSDGTDLTTVLRSEADDLPMKVTEEDISLMQQYSGAEEDPTKALLRESRDQTQLLNSIDKHVITISALVGFLVAVGLCGFVLLCIGLFR